MEQGYTLEYNGRFIHLRHKPGFVVTPQDLPRVWADLARASRDHDCRKVLAEGPLARGGMSTLDALDSGGQAAQGMPGLTMAIFAPGYREDELTRFFKNVAHNRGADIEFFSDRAAALKWLGVEDNNAGA